MHYRALSKRKHTAGVRAKIASTQSESTDASDVAYAEAVGRLARATAMKAAVCSHVIELYMNVFYSCLSD